MTMEIVLNLESGPVLVSQTIYDLFKILSNFRRPRRERRLLFTWLWLMKSLTSLENFSAIARQDALNFL